MVLIIELQLSILNLKCPYKLHRFSVSGLSSLFLAEQLCLKMGKIMAAAAARGELFVIVLATYASGPSLPPVLSIEWSVLNGYSIIWQCSGKILAGILQYFLALTRT